MADLYAPYQHFLQNAEKQDLLRHLIPVERCDRHNRKSSRFLKSGGKLYINLSSNDYLGLASHPFLGQRAGEWAEKYGAGTGSSRLVTGNLGLFEKLEEKLARLKHKEAALIMGAGFQTNATILQALFDTSILKDKPLVFSDRLNHASIHFGCAAANIRQIRYRHCNIEHLQTQLEKYSSSRQPKFIVTETVFSMDGDSAPIAAISSLARQHNAMLIVDDAHDTGINGYSANSNGAGMTDLVIGTFSKTFGSYGAYVAGNTGIIRFLKNRCHGLVYSTALPPPVLGAIDAALDLIPGLDRERKHLINLSDRLRQKLKKEGHDTGQSTSQIIPLITGRPDQALSLSKKLRQNGFWATAIRPPTVPKNSARLRFSLSSALEEQDIEKLLSILVEKPGQAF